MATRYSHRYAFELNGTRVLAGTREVISLPVPDLYVHADLSIPVHVVHGKKTGLPCSSPVPYMVMKSSVLKSSGACFQRGESVASAAR